MMVIKLVTRCTQGREWQKLVDMSDKAIPHKEEVIVLSYHDVIDQEEKCLSFIINQRMHIYTSNDPTRNCDIQCAVRCTTAEQHYDTLRSLGFEEAESIYR